MVDLSVFDAAALLALVGDDKELMQEIVELYLKEYPRILGDIRAAAASGEVRALEFSAHALKGSVSNMAAKRAYAAAIELETHAHADQLPAARDSLTTLERELSRLERALTGLAPEPTR